MSIQQYIFARTGVDIGFNLNHDLRMCEHDGMLYITGCSDRGLVAIRVIAKKVVRSPPDFATGIPQLARTRFFLVF